MSKLRITLKSDLCAAGGDGFASVIDTDVSYDRYGFPLIGARRVKGCLREAAELIGTEAAVIDSIFGVSGSGESGALRISDAHLSGIDGLVSDAANIPAAQVISLFTYIRAATAIENDTAKDGSLRFTRVVRHYSPLDDGKETVFEADVTLDAAYAKEFSDICKALRNIGLHRNRGLGAVKCEYLSENSQPVQMQKPLLGNDEEVEFSYLIRLKDDMMIPGSNSTETADFIPGTAVLGYFAAQYLSANAYSEEFEKMFLKQNIRFSNLYISDETGGTYYPAPVILGKIKGESGVFNMVTYHNSNDHIMKPLKKGYCDHSCRIQKPIVETIYHHKARTQDETEKEKETLYTQTALCKNQYFRGTVSGKRAFVDVIHCFLNDAQKNGVYLRFGRSKTAQYSACSIMEVKPVQSANPETVKIPAGEIILVLLRSDVLLADGMGGYALTAEALQSALGEQFADLKPDKTVADPNGKPLFCSALRYREISGFHAKWNLQKPHIRTIAAGSTLVFRAEKDMQLPKYLYIGEKQNEGYGAVMCCRAADYEPATAEKVAIKQTEGSLKVLIEKSQNTEKMRSAAVEVVRENAALIKQVNASQVGRYAMMVKQSENPGALVKLICGDLNEKNEHKKADMERFEKLYNKAKEKYSVENATDWADYLLLILTLIKYQKRGGENA